MNGPPANLPSPEEPAPAAASAKPLAPLWLWPTRLALLFAGVVLPPFCFGVGYPDSPTWQSGNLDAYAKLLLARGPCVALYPFLLYNMTCMTLLIFAPERFLKKFIVRLGIYTGVLLAVQYWVLFAIALTDGTHVAAFVFGLAATAFCSALAATIAWGLVAVIYALARAFGWKLLWAVAVLLPVGVALESMMWAHPRHSLFLGFLGSGCFVCLFCATPWAVMAYTEMAIYVSRRSGVRRLRFSLAQLLGVITWLAAYLGAWRTSLIWMLQEYAKLPTTAPDDCYVCTAAARGHRRLVRGEARLLPGGKLTRVNDQMRYLKAAELLLASVSPAGHRECRRIYDRIGPLLAAILVYPVLADAAYLSLKPGEWLCRAGLALLLGGHRDLVRNLYRGRS